MIEGTEEVRRVCTTCKHFYVMIYNYPCCECFPRRGYNLWEAKEDVEYVQIPRV